MENKLIHRGTMKKSKNMRKDNEEGTVKNDSENEPLKSRKGLRDKDYNQHPLETSSDEVAKILHKGCECTVSCFLGLDAELVYKHRLNIAELSKNEQDFYLMGILRAVLMDTKDKHAKRLRSAYIYMGKKVCLYAFLYLENVTVYTLKKIRSHVMTNGVVAIQHGNLHKMPYNAFSLEMYKKVETFLRSYLNIDKNHPSKSIVLNLTLTKVYQDYHLSFQKSKKSDEKAMSFSCFRLFFRKQFPHVRLHNQRNYQGLDKLITPQQQQQDTKTKKEPAKKKLNQNPDQQFINTDDLIYYDAELSDN